MRIGEASRKSGVPERMIRHYEKLGLLPTADRGSSGYRSFEANDVDGLKLIAAARRLDMSVDLIREFLALLADPFIGGGNVERMNAILEDRIADAELLQQALLDAMGDSGKTWRSA